jgi:predicted SAM-dependent methyltransferase
MRLNLGCGTDIRDNYINIDTNIQHPAVKNNDVRNLNILQIADQSVEEILACDILEYIKYNEIPNTLKHWCDKITKGGEMYIESIDYNMLATAMADDRFKPDELNNILFDKQKASIHSLTSLEPLLNQLGMATTTKGYRNNKFFIRVNKL